MKLKLQSVSVLLGGLLVVAIVCSQLFGFQVNPSSSLKKGVATEEQKKTNHSGDETYVSLPSFSLPSSVHVHLNLDSYCLFEIVLEEKQEIISSPQTAPLQQKFLITLFRTIISPNAP
jgi:hypothetical protein